MFKENEAPGLCTSALARKLDVTLMCWRRNVIRELRDNDLGNDVKKGWEIFPGAIYEGGRKVVIIFQQEKEHTGVGVDRGSADLQDKTKNS